MGAVLYNCPYCEREIDVEPCQSEFVCPHCGGSFVLPHGEAGEMDQEPAEEAPSNREALDALRIRQISLAKRALLRRRSLLIAGALVCAMGAVQLFWSGVREVLNQGLRPQNAGLTVAAAGLLVVALLLLRKSRRMRRQLDEKPPQADLPPPDFTPLSDGSQQWKNLEKM